MKKYLFLIASFVLFFNLNAFAQEGGEQEKIIKDKPRSLQGNYISPELITSKRIAMPYPDVRSADMIWAKTIYRTMDLREKMNHPIYFPVTEMAYRKSLIQAIIEGIQTNKITAYDSEEFVNILSTDDVRQKLGGEDRTQVVEKLDGTGDTTLVVSGSINWANVREMLIKEEWFFDRHNSQMAVRIVGICPILVYQKQFDTEDGEEMQGEEFKKQLFWIYYPEARQYLNTVPCYVASNEAAGISFDDVFQKRMFSSKIIAEGSMDQTVDSYTQTGFEAMMESQRIERELLNKEHDFWEY